MIDSRVNTFLSLCRLMNYRKVAEELNMTQPGVTQHIQFLEAEYGCKFFEYDHHTLKMTEKAEAFKEYAQSILYQENKIREELLSDAGINLKIGATKTIGEFVIENHCKNYLMGKNNFLSIEVDNTEHLLSKVDQGDLDFAMVEGIFDRTKYKYQLYKKENFLGICNKSHRFAGKAVDIEDIFHEHLFVREKGSGTRDIFENTLLEKNHKLSEFQNISEVGNFNLLLSLQKSLNGITFAYQAILEKNKDLSSFTIKNMNSQHEFNYVYLDTQFSQKYVDYFDTYRR
ncbi:MAG: LysR family transcriptional regulator [Treponema sp.]|nr:LysR family transcriptional regulator [Treponema sp.]